jgi:hypothetical protein
MCRWRWGSGLRRALGIERTVKERKNHVMIIVSSCPVLNDYISEI